MEKYVNRYELYMPNIIDNSHNYFYEVKAIKVRGIDEYIIYDEYTCEWIMESNLKLFLINDEKMRNYYDDHFRREYEWINTIKNGYKVMERKLKGARK